MLLLLALAALLLAPQPWGLVAVAAALALEILELVFWKRFLRRYRLRSGPETLVGAPATVVADCAPDGRVRVRGELWSARSSAPVVVGERVRITAIEGLTLRVEPDREAVGPRKRAPGEGPLVSEGRAASDAAAGPSVLKSSPSTSATA